MAGNQNLKNKRKVKQVIVLRKDLNMRAGKMVSQGAHASLAVILGNLNDERVKTWLDNEFTKITLRVDSEEELLNILQKAKDNGMLTTLIVDAGKTEFHGIPTKTAIAIIDYEEKFVDITDHLKLL